ncbi:iron ABC transporter permease [Desulfothermus okinawensis JCM 13304]
MEVVKIISSKLTGITCKNISTIHYSIIWDVRLPRIICAALVGGALSICGVVFQGILLNPLADPYTLGISAGAAFGASLALLFGMSFLGIYTVPFFAFVFGLVTLLVVIYLSSTSSSGISSNNLILSGVIVSAILSAGISFCKYLAQERVSVIVFWLLGSFASSTWTSGLLILLCLIVSFAVFIFYFRDLNLLSLGGKTASSMGVDPKKVRILLLVFSSLLTGVCVSFSGIIGFVGLLVPHMVRSVVGPNHLKLLPASLIAGAIMLTLADTLTRAYLPTEVPIGVLTALIGGPFFCYIFRKKQVGF